ncbi:organic cation transporter protein-like [Ylistrum balloti]|uniref:organic cation transporter protein-like n=1 Tax=Ylistrum balloti TaxID=509963 RepID=UPI0029058E10|nr:organic cation transporter protein-like [Ylistrum balloti]
MANLDDILKKIGEFGRYQIWLFVLLCLPSTSNGCYMMMMILLAYTPKHRCKIPGYENDTWAVQGSYHSSLINYTIPDSEDDFYDYDRCHMYKYSGNTTDTIRTRCSAYVYDKEIFDETIVTRGDLVCEQGMKPAHAQVVFYVGVMIGDLFFGQLSDSIGRSKTLLITSIILLLSSVGTAFAPDFYSFTVLQFIVGASNHGMFVLVCVLCIELIGPSRRMVAGVSIHVLFPFGLFWLAAAGYLFRTWWAIQLAVGVPCAIYVAYWWLMPESPRWLISQGKYGEAEQILRKVAEKNGTQYPEKYDLSQLEQHKPGRMWQLFTHKTLAWRTLIIFLNWFSIAQIYYGVTIHMKNLGGNFYFKFIMLALVEIPAVAITLLMLSKIGRKKVHAFFMILAGVSCLLTIFTVIIGGPSFEPATLALCCLGKLGAAAGFSIIYVYSSELFPTVVRNGGMGASSCVARFGSMSAPYIAKIGDSVGSMYGQAIPLIVFGLIALAAGTLTLLLPETWNRRLPDTIQDGIRFGKEFDQNKKDYTEGCDEESMQAKELTSNGTDSSGREQPAENKSLL